MPNPKARQDDIVVQEIFDELVIYDLERDRAHSLNPTAAFVWQHCDGQRTPAELARLLQQEFKVPQAEALLWLTLGRLEKAHLLEGKVPRSNGRRTLTRRQVLKMAGVGIALLPVIKTIVAPTAAQAVTLKGRGECCSTDGECQSGVCSTDPACTTSKSCQ